MGICKYVLAQLSGCHFLCNLESTPVCVSVYVCLRVCVCVLEKERKREREFEENATKRERV